MTTGPRPAPAAASVASHPPLSRAQTLLMAAACGVAVANIYYNQPLLGIIGRDMPGKADTVGLIPTTTQVGYALGLFLLVPLGDLIDRRRLIVGQFLALALALVGAALAPGAAGLALASLAVGAMASVAQQVVPLAATLAVPEKRGATVGMVMSGLLCGILFGRTLAGYIGDHAGWRAMFAVGAALALVMTGLSAAAIPHGPPPARISYGDLLRSLWSLWRQEPSLRRAALVQGAMFGAFSAFWATLALHLEEPAFHLSAAVAGLFGVVGAVGVLVAPIAGRMADRRGPHLIIGAGALVVLASWVLFAVWNTLTGLIVGVILIDFGLQSALVSHQHLIYALRPDARSRVNTLFMTGMFIFGAIGSAGAAVAWRLLGWNGVSLYGCLLATIALAGHVHGRRRSL